jgi:CRP/FNR family cyclic AMP-dependent transcriptional regulator
MVASPAHDAMDRLLSSDKRRFMKKAETNMVNKRTIKKDCIEDFIKSVPVFLHLSDDALGEVRKHLFKRHYTKGKKVFEKGDHVETLYIVEAGRIEIYKTDDEGRRLTMWYINPGEIFCVPTLLTGNTVTNAEAIKDTMMYCLDKADFDDQVSRYSAFSAALLRCLSSRIQTYSSSVESFAFTGTSGRVADILLRYNTMDDKGNTVCQLSQNEITSLAGTCRETVSRTLNKFKKDNIITIERRMILIRDIDGLKKRLSSGL